MTDILYINGQAVPRLDLNIDGELFLHRLTILYGPSGSGKSSLIFSIMNALKNDIPLAIIFNPTNSMNGDYNGIVPTACIHDDVTKDMLKKIFQRQTNVLAMYDLVRDIEQLKPLYKRIADSDSLSKLNRLQTIYQKGKSDIKSGMDADDAEAALDELESKYNKKSVKIMRSAIIANMAKLNSHSLTDMQKTLLRNFMICPNLLILIDDCAASIKEWKDLTETKQLFFQGRHYRVSTIITMQNEAIIPPPLRMNAHVSIFTTEKIVNTFYAKASSGATSDEKKQISRIATTVFAPSDDRSRPNYRKLIVFGQIVKTQYRIQYIIGNPKKKRFGSAALWTFCDHVKRDQPSSLTSNSFSKMFALKNAPTLESVPNA